MITKFRIEGEAPRKQELIDELLATGSEVMRLVTPGGANGNWQCTDDVISQVKKHNIPIGYQGRMNFIFKRADTRDAADY